MANHRRQSINKAHSIPYLKSSKTRLGEIQTYLHYIQPSIGVGFKILVGAPLFFPLDGQSKGGVVVGTTQPAVSPEVTYGGTKKQVSLFRWLWFPE